MPKPVKYSRMFTIRISEDLERELRDAADADFIPVATLGRAILTDFAHRRFVERNQAADSDALAAA
jgi:hypothetical protein